MRAAHTRVAGELRICHFCSHGFARYCVKPPPSVVVKGWDVPTLPRMPDYVGRSDTLRPKLDPDLPGDKVGHHLNPLPQGERKLSVNSPVTQP